MRILPIFPDRNLAIYAVHYDGEPIDELRKVFAQWSDVFYLESFFEEHRQDLRHFFRGCISLCSGCGKTNDQ